MIRFTHKRKSSHFVALAEDSTQNSLNQLEAAALQNKEALLFACDQHILSPFNLELNTEHYQFDLSEIKSANSLKAFLNIAQHHANIKHLPRAFSDERLDEDSLYAILNWFVSQSTYLEKNADPHLKTKLATKLDPTLKKNFDTIYNEVQKYNRIKNWHYGTKVILVILICLIISSWLILSGASLATAAGLSWPIILLIKSWAQLIGGSLIITLMGSGAFTVIGMIWHIFAYFFNKAAVSHKQSAETALEQLNSKEKSDDPEEVVKNLKSHFITVALQNSSQTDTLSLKISPALNQDNQAIKRLADQANEQMLHHLAQVISVDKAKKIHLNFESAGINPMLLQSFLNSLSKEKIITLDLKNNHLNDEAIPPLAQFMLEQTHPLTIQCENNFSEEGKKKFNAFKDQLSTYQKNKKDHQKLLYRIAFFIGLVLLICSPLISITFINTLITTLPFLAIFFQFSPMIKILGIVAFSLSSLALSFSIAKKSKEGLNKEYSDLQTLITNIKQEKKPQVEKGSCKPQASHTEEFTSTQVNSAKHQQQTTERTALNGK